MAIKRVSTKDMSREQWLEMRKKGIGGSDISALMGLNPWKSAYELYFDKLGILEDKETTEAMRIGTDLEQYVAERYMEVTGKRIQRTNFIYFDENHDFMLANIDREVVGENAAVECKTANLFSSVDYESGEVPTQYYGQYFAGLVIAVGALIVAMRPGVATWVRVLLFIAYGFGLILFRSLFTLALDIQIPYGLALDTMWSIVAIFIFWVLVANSKKRDDAK